MFVANNTLDDGNSGRSYRVGLGLWILLLLAAWCFWPATTGPFVFDDFPNLQNLAELGGHINRESLGYYLYAFLDNPGRPLAALSFLIEDSTWPTLPAAFKRDNILFHLVAGTLVFWLALLLAKLRNRETAMVPAVIALACTAMWLLQPMQLSATMLVVQRMNILSTVFMLAGLLAYLKVLDVARLPEFARVAAAGISLGLFGTIALLCKENGALIFAYATALNLTLLRDRVLQLRPFNRGLLLWGTAAPILLLLSLALVHHDSLLRDYHYVNFSLTERLLTEPRILFQYLGMILLPRIGGQGIFHDDYVVSHSLLDPASTIVALIGICALACSSVWLRRRYPVYSFAVLWFFAGHLIESTVVPLELYFEHRNYLPMVGPLFALAYLACATPRRYLYAAVALLVVWICSAAFLTRYNAGIWGDRGKLTLVWARQSPDSIRATQTLGIYYYDRGARELARDTFDAAIVRFPEHDELRFQRTLIDCLDRGLAPGQWQSLVTIAGTTRYGRAIPDVVSAFGKQAIGTDRCHGTLEATATRQLIAALLANPRFSRDDDTRGYMHYELAKLALADRDLDGLMREMDLSYALRPNPLVPREQAIHLLSAGLPEQALHYLDRSDSTPAPWPKSWFLDIRTKNLPLRRSAEAMRDGLQHNNPR